MKNIVFLTGTRADFGKLKSLIHVLDEHPNYNAHLFVTGMHLLETYGYTLIEVEREGFDNIHTFANHTSEATMDLTLAKTIQGFSEYVTELKPDLIVIHGDRVEALAGAVVGSLNNILVAHIEGGELSGTIDELIRHSTSKMSHVHFVSNESASKRLIQMGEIPESVYVIGSPDVDIMFSEGLPSLEESKAHYDIDFNEYHIAMFHPVTTEIENMQNYAEKFADALIRSNKQFVVIFPNNDLGSTAIIDAYKRFDGNSNFRVFPSIRFEYFLVLLKNSKGIVGNSSAGIREAPYYGIRTINVGTRQKNRSQQEHFLNTSYESDEILEALNTPDEPFESDVKAFGSGNSSDLFLQCLEDGAIWNIPHQKQFIDI